MIVPEYIILTISPKFPQNDWHVIFLSSTAFPNNKLDVLVSKKCFLIVSSLILMENHWFYMFLLCFHYHLWGARSRTWFNKIPSDQKSNLSKCSEKLISGVGGHNSRMPTQGIQEMVKFPSWPQWMKKFRGTFLEDPRGFSKHDVSTLWKIKKFEKILNSLRERASWSRDNQESRFLVFGVVQLFRYAL